MTSCAQPRLLSCATARNAVALLRAIGGSSSAHTIGSFAPLDMVIWEGDVGVQAFFLKTGAVRPAPITPNPCPSARAPSPGAARRPEGHLSASARHRTALRYPESS